MKALLTRGRLLVCLGPVFGLLMAAQGDVEYRTGVWRGLNVTYRVADGWAIAEGDMILGRTEELEGSPKSAGRPSLTRNGDQFRWTDRTIPYVIDADIPNPQRVADAIKYWNDNTPIRMTPKTTEANYLRFIRQQNNGVCFSAIGMTGGEQTIRVDDLCGAGGLIHEIGHTVGLYHEQSRTDRDRYIIIHYENIDTRRIGDYNQQISAASDLGPYDYGSIMHYPATGGDAYLPQLPLIETVPRGIPIGQRIGLSAGDLDAVNRLYNVTSQATTIDTVPAGLDILADGGSYPSPHSFTWEAGSTHHIEVAPVQGSGTTRYLFARWNDGGDMAHDITAGADGTIYRAMFLRQFKITTGANPVASGTVDLDPASDDGFYTEGTPLRAIATPAAGFVYRSWVGPVTAAHGVSENPAPFRVTSAYNYTANFTRTQLVSFLTNPALLRLTIDGNTNTASWLPSWNAGTSHTVQIPSPQQNPSASSRYVFTGWSDDSTALSRTITAPTAETAYTANFRPEHLLSVNIDGTGSVDREPASGDGFYEAGTTVRLTPRPGTGFQFVNWIGHLTGTEANRTVTVDGQRTVTAIFRAANALAFNSTLHAATRQQTGFAAPGELLLLIGTQNAPASSFTAQPDADGKFPTIVGGTRVLFDGIAAPVLAVRGTQVTTVVPYSVAGSRVTNVLIEYQGRRTNTAIVQIVDTVPGVFTSDDSGSGPIAGLNEDGTPNSTAAPAGAGSTITFQATGLGLTMPAVSEADAVADPLPVPVVPVGVSIGGVEAEVVSVAAASGQPAGLMRISVRIPDNAPSGTVPLVLRCGNVLARQSTTVAVR